MAETGEERRLWKTAEHHETRPTIQSSQARLPAGPGRRGPRCCRAGTDKRTLSPWVTAAAPISQKTSPSPEHRENRHKFGAGLFRALALEQY